MVNTILLLVAYDNFMQNFINNLYQIAIDSKKEVKKLLKNINSQLREYDEKKEFELLDEKCELISVVGMYLTEEFDRNYIINAYKASLDIDEYGVLGEDRSEIEYYIDSFPTEEKLNLNTLLSKGYEYAEVLEDIFGEESFRYEF